MADFKGQRIGALPWTSSFAASNFTIDQTTDFASWVFKSRTTDPITWVAFRCGAESGTATTWKIGLQSPAGANGNPDGTWLGGGSPATKTFTNADVVAGGFYRFNLDNSYTPTRGEDLAVTIGYDSGTAPSAGVNDLSPTISGGWAVPSANPYPDQCNAGTWSKVNGTPVFGYGTASAAYGWPMETAVAQSITSSGTNEYGVKLNLPTTWGATYQCIGVRAFVVFPAAATNSVVMRLYDGTTVIQDSTNDQEIVASVTSRWFEAYFDESSLENLSHGGDYRLVFAPTTANAMTLHGLQQDTAADWEAYPGGQLFPSTSRAGGAWTDDATIRFMIEPIISDWTVASSSGTVYVPSGGAFSHIREH